MAVPGDAILVLSGERHQRRLEQDLRYSRLNCRAGLHRCDEIGAKCNRAGSTYDQPGTCVKSTCSRFLPGPNGGVHTSFDCNLCSAAEHVGSAAPSALSVSPSQGSASGGQATSAGSTGSGSDAKAGTDPVPAPKKGGCAGCAVAADETPATALLLLATFSGLGVALARRSSERGRARPGTR